MIPAGRHKVLLLHGDSHQKDLESGWKLKVWHCTHLECSQIEIQRNARVKPIDVSKYITLVPQLRRPLRLSSMRLLLKPHTQALWKSRSICMSVMLNVRPYLEQTSHSDPVSKGQRLVSSVWIPCCDETLDRCSCNVVADE
jgi:hypothetical protein